MKRVLIALAFAVLGCNPKTQLTIENESAIDLQDKPVILSRSEIPGGIREGLFPTVLSPSGELVPSQIEDVDGDGIWDQLVFVTDFQAGEAKKFDIAWVNQLPEFTKRTSVRFGVRDSLNDVVKPKITDVFFPHELPGVNGYQPYQTDGPSWENDKVGFRHYLDGRNSKDVFGKKVEYMSPENVGINKDGVTEDNYHVMEEWGRDIMNVGNSLGLGGISLEIGGERLRRLGIIEGDPKGNVDSTVFTILQEGPVHSQMLFDYKTWRPLDEDRTYNLTETVEIWPGVHGYKNTVHLKDPKGDEVVLVGLVNSRTNKPLSTIYENEEWLVLGTHDKQTYEKEWYLGLALVLPKSAFINTIKAPDEGRISKTYLARMKADQPFSYYAMACWELRDSGFIYEEYYQMYLQNFVDQLTVKLKVR